MHTIIDFGGQNAHPTYDFLVPKRHFTHQPVHSQTLVIIIVQRGSIDVFRKKRFFPPYHQYLAGGFTAGSRNAKSQDLLKKRAASGCSQPFYLILVFVMG